MTPQEFKSVEPLFHQALEFPPGAERERFVREQCPATLAGYLQALLEADQEQPQAPPEAPIPLPHCGPYQAESVLGSGGMGLVYRAVRSDGQFQQTVALKLLRSVARTEPERARFRAERQILAQMQHPHIAALHDGGVTAEGEPYLVMEYVDGEPLDCYCDKRRLPLASRLVLFRQVLDAVDYAHRNFIVHGDLKPSNILVTAPESAKLLDFGTSRFLDEETHSTLAVAMTPKYASPEQLRGERLTTTSDVFSLGLILYELLIGASAFPSASSLMSVMARAVAETNPTDPGSAITEAAAAARGCSIAQLREAVSGDLASIVHKALAHDPARRYQSVADFAADVERFQNCRPVMARRQTLLYRMGKFVMRHRLPVAAVLAAGIGLAALAGYAYRQQRQALEQGRRAQVTSRFLMRLFQSLNPIFGGRWQMTAAELVDRSLPLAARMLASEPASLAEFQLSAAGILQEYGSGSGLAMAKQAVDSARRSGDFNLQAATLAYLGAEQAAVGQCPAALQSEDAARSLATLHAKVLTREWKIVVFINEVQARRMCGGDLRALRPHMLEALTLARQIPSDSLQEENPPLGLKVVALANAAMMLGCDEGQALRHEALAMSESSEGLRGTLGIIVLNEEGECLVKAGRAAEAVPLLRRSLELSTAAFGPRSFVAQVPQADLTYALAQAGQPEEAIRQARITLANLAPPRNLLSQRLAAQALMTAGDTKEALPLARELAAVPLTALHGRACLFVANVEAGQYETAKPYRADAEKLATLVPAGTPWRVKLDTALRQAADR